MAIQAKLANRLDPICARRTAWLAFSAATALAVGSTAMAQSPPSQPSDPFSSAGGKASCAETFSDAGATQQAENWVAGVFIGKNYLSGAKAGSTIGRASVFLAVRQYCSSQPRVSLGDATRATYEKLLSEGR